MARLPQPLAMTVSIGFTVVSEVGDPSLRFIRGHFADGSPHHGLHHLAPVAATGSDGEVFV
jgi:hypothetical protein